MALKTATIPRTLPSVALFHTTRLAMSTTKTHESLTVVSTTNSSAAVGPYSQGIKVDSLLFCSGCMPIEPGSTEIVSGGVEEQAKQVLKNLKGVVEAGGSELGKIVKTNIYLKSMGDFATVNEIYANFFGEHRPARTTVAVATLPKEVLVEIECIASLK